LCQAHTTCRVGFPNDDATLLENAEVIVDVTGRRHARRPTDFSVRRRSAVVAHVGANNFEDLLLLIAQDGHVAAVLARTGRYARKPEQMFACTVSIRCRLGQMFVSGQRTDAMAGLRDRPDEWGGRTDEVRASGTYVEPIDRNANQRGLPLASLPSRNL
jgi:hypothetical protein